MARVLLGSGELPGSTRRPPLESTYADALQQLRKRNARRLPEEIVERTVIALGLPEEWRAFLTQKALAWNTTRAARRYRQDVVERAIATTLSAAVDDHSSHAPIALAQDGEGRLSRTARRRRRWLRSGAVLLTLAAIAAGVLFVATRERARAPEAARVLPGLPSPLAELSGRRSQGANELGLINGQDEVPQPGAGVPKDNASPSPPRDGSPYGILSSRTRSTDKCLVQVFALDTQRAFAVGYGGMILVTSDHGKQWRIQASNVRSRFYAVAFFDPLHGIAVGENGITVTTADGGRSWRVRKTGLSRGLYGATLVSEDAGWTVGRKGTILATADAGKTWWTQASRTDAWLSGVAFPDELHGVVVGEGGTILTTSDAGASWVERHSGTSKWLCAVAFSDREHGWAVGQDGTVVATHDGGRSWRRQSARTRQNLFSVSFADSRNGWAVGMNGTVIATANGGASWRSLSLGTNANLWGVCAADGGHVWAVGDEGTVLHGHLPIP